jgi:hypothetical protein
MKSSLLRQKTVTSYTYGHLPETAYFQSFCMSDCKYFILSDIGATSLSNELRYSPVSASIRSQLLLHPRILYDIDSASKCFWTTSS